MNPDRANGERQRRYRERRLAQEGATAVTIYLPKRGSAIADFKQAAARVVAEPRLTVRLVDTITGRAVRWRRPVV